MVSDKINLVGLESSIYQTAGHPIVVGRNKHSSDKPTVMIYGHYDVQPADQLIGSRHHLNHLLKKAKSMPVAQQITKDRILHIS